MANLRAQNVKNLGLYAIKGNKPWNFGKVSPLKGKKRPTRSKEWSKKISLSKIGKVSPLKGIKLSKETRLKMSLARKGKIFSKTHLENINKNRPRGENHYLWKRDRTQIKRQEERNSPNDKQWKRAVYKRDNFKCRIADENCKGRIEAHHILSWRDYPELRFIINNGITLCHAHHPRVRNEEKRLSPYFMELVSVSKE